MFAALIAEQYPVEGATVRVLAGSAAEGRVVLRADLPSGDSWLVKATRNDQPVPEWFYASGAPDWLSLLHSRAATLEYLAAAAYPAPRVIRTRTGALVGQAPGWYLLATTFIAGAVTQPTLAQLRLLG